MASGLVPSVRIDLGVILGTAAVAGVHRFAGIPFALPPVGNRRFTRAVESRVPYAGGVFNASRMGAPCMQNPDGDPRPPGYEEGPPPNEDCLTLNVYRPASAAPGAKLPVMVWVYGGGLCSGYSGNAQFNGSQLALQQGVIVVTVSYRLGALGFLPLGALPGFDFDGGGSGGMNGMNDVIVGLHWVRRHIGAFGGRATDITLFGESSGGYLSCVLSVAPAARGLFTRAALQSGPCAGGPPTSTGRGWGPSSLALAHNVSQRVMADLNVSTLAELRSVSAELVQWPDELMSDLAVAPYFTGYFADSFVMGATTTDAAWKQGQINPDVLLIGHTSKDGTSAFYGTAPTLGLTPGDPVQTDAAAYREALKAAWGANAPQIEAQYPLSMYGGSPQAAFLQADADAYVICPSYRLAGFAASAGRQVWSYEFAHFQPQRSGPQPASVRGAVSGGETATTTPGWGCDNGPELDVVSPEPLPTTLRWATHGAEVRYVFGSEAAPDNLGPPNNWTICDFTTEERTLSQVMLGYWAAFAANADPNAGCGGHAGHGGHGGHGGQPCPPWPRSIGGAAGMTQMLVVPDAEGELGPVHAPHQAHCAFWETLFPS